MPLYILWIGLVLLVVVAAGLALVYHSLIQRRLDCLAAWTQLVGVLKGRLALAPHLLAVTENYAPDENITHELQTACQQASQAQGVEARAQAENRLVCALASLFQHAELYPGLKNHAEFARLGEELTTAENRIRQAAEQYNRKAEAYNAFRNRPTNRPVATACKLRAVEAFPQSAIEINKA